MIWLGRSVVGWVFRIFIHMEYEQGYKYQCLGLWLEVLCGAGSCEQAGSGCRDSDSGPDSRGHLYCIKVRVDSRRSGLASMVIINYSGSTY